MSRMSLNRRDVGVSLVVRIRIKRGVEELSETCLKYVKVESIRMAIRNVGDPERTPVCQTWPTFTLNSSSIGTLCTQVIDDIVDNVTNTRISS
jgi:hypothetical protein